MTTHAPADVLYEGTAMKQGSLRKSWRERKFVLDRFGILRYYKVKCPEEARLKGEIHLSSCVGMVCQKDFLIPDGGWPRDAEHCIAIQASKRTLYLYVANQSELDRWTAYLMQFIRLERHLAPDYQDLSADLP